MLLLHSLLANCTSLLIFMLFGVGEGTFDAAFLWLKRLLVGEERRGAKRRRIRGSVAVQELTDVIDAVAAGTGYEVTKESSGHLERAKAAKVIQRYIAGTRTLALRRRHPQDRYPLQSKTV